MKKIYLKTFSNSRLRPLAISAATLLSYNIAHAQKTPGICDVAEDLILNLSDAISFSPALYEYTNTNSVDVFAGSFTVNRFSSSYYICPLPFAYTWSNDIYPFTCSIGPTFNLYNTYIYAEEQGYPEYKAMEQVVYGMTVFKKITQS